VFDVVTVKFVYISNGTFIISCEFTHERGRYPKYIANPQRKESASQANMNKVGRAGQNNKF
jgi:hypothetical protein